MIHLFGVDGSEGVVLTEQEHTSPVIMEVHVVIAVEAVVADGAQVFQLVAETPHLGARLAA